MAWRLEGLTRPRPDQVTAEAGLLLVAAGAWAGTVVLARGMTGATWGLATWEPASGTAHTASAAAGH